MLPVAFSTQLNPSSDSFVTPRLPYLSSTHSAHDMAPSRIFFLVIALLTIRSHAQQKCVNVPFNPSALGKGVTEVGGCDSFGLILKTSFKFLKWGLSFTPVYLHSCPSEIVVAYRKKNRPAMLYYRPGPGPEAFKTIAPVEYRKFKKGSIPKWPCYKVKVRVQKVHVWRNRKLFVRLISEAVQGIEGIRTIDCEGSDEKGYDPNRMFNWAEVNERARKEWLSTTAVTYLRSLAFSNFFCV